jgi:hypothetical protein
MRRLRALWLRAVGILRRGGAEDEFAAELDAHMALHVEDGMRAGLSAAPGIHQAGWR